jgi:hypothetical protein
MNQTTAAKPRDLPSKLAKLTWQLWLAAMAITILTRGLSIKLPAEILALLLICLGFLLGLVLLALIPKLGAKNILNSALAGVLLNGIMLAIAIPNFIQARAAAQQQVMAGLKDYKIADALWQSCRVAGLQLLSPVGLGKQEVMTADPSEKVEVYVGQLPPYAFTVALNRRELATNSADTLESYTAEAADLLREKFPQDFKSGSQDGLVDGLPAKKLSAEFQSRETPVRDEAIIFFKQPFAWEVQVIGPKDFPAFKAQAEKIFDSIKLLPPGA